MNNPAQTPENITIDGNITNTNLQSQSDSKAPLNNPTCSGTVRGITKDMVQLGDVDNTSDLAKPTSTATQTALSLKAPLNNLEFQEL